MTPSERKDRFDQLTRLGCICCKIHHGVYTQPEIHHLLGIKYRATGKKANDEHTIGLCPAHHRIGGYGISVHSGVKAWEQNWGTQEFMLDKTNQLIGDLH